MLCDEEKSVLKAYGVWGKKKLYGREYEGIFRNTYVIDENGIIEQFYKKVSVKTHAQDILAVLQNCKVETQIIASLHINYLQVGFGQGIILDSYRQKISEKIPAHERRRWIEFFHLAPLHRLH